jgi:hypothetical protein
VSESEAVEEIISAGERSDGGAKDEIGGGGRERRRELCGARERKKNRSVRL